MSKIITPNFTNISDLHEWLDEKSTRIAKKRFEKWKNHHPNYGDPP